MLRRSPSGTLALSSCLLCLSTASDSPVKLASCTLRLAASTKRASAGTMLPVSMRMMSPGTNKGDSKSITLPLRRTRTNGAAIALRAWMARSARYSCTTPNMALITTMVRMAINSGILPEIAEIKAAINKITTSGSLICSHRMSSGFFAPRSTNSLRPNCCRRASASTSVKPCASSTCCCLSVTSVDSVCQSTEEVGVVPTMFVVSLTFFGV